MCTFEQLYAFLKEYYLHSRFEGRNSKEWGEDYSNTVALSHYENLQKYGEGRIGMYECRLGRVLKYDQDLTITNPDAPPAQIQKQAPHLTHLF